MTILFYPYTLKANHYAKLQTQMLTGLPADVIPLTPRTILKRLFHRSETIAILNFFEDRTSYLQSKPNRTLLVNIALLLLLKLTCAKIIWVRHNFWPHDLPRNYPRQELLLKFLDAVATKTVTHRLVDGIASEEAPHPLYRDMPPADSARDIEFLAFGAIKRYKGLDALLEAWPAERSLTIAGSISEPDLLAELTAIVERRALNVTFIPRFIADEELDDLLQRTKFVVMAHQDDAMIVSGTFFHAASLGANVLARRSAFSTAMRERFTFVQLFDDGDLASTIAHLTYVEPRDVFAAATSYNGIDRCRDAWKPILGL